ncbi:MAG: DNA helicase UvrD [Gammaproteobacteria bacterium]|nr:MAG: DNA helicase UvrD [Gammaproteobacteria bacterium]
MTAVSSRQPADQQVRETALDASRSFVVQAPAGSGKTGLLIQRYLRLLATVEHPEEIIAITFTRKAAAEMRDRVLDALAMAASAEPEDGGREPAQNPYQETTLALARAVVARDVHKGWSLNAQPGRMRILTIDALCRTIATQMPWLSRLGGDALIVDDVSPLYRQAARDVVGLLHEDTPWSECVVTLVSHLDGDLGRFERMLVEMLSRRDQWLRYLLPGSSDPGSRRRELEAELAKAVGEELALLRAAVPRELADELAAVCAYAGDTLLDHASRSPAVACAGLAQLPGASAPERRHWQGVAATLLTREGNWRKTLTRREGFPADKQPRLQEMRARGLDLLARLAGAFQLRERLHAVGRLPEPVYTDGQWRVLHALLEILPVATACLRVVFAERGQVDYSEITNAARQALGGDESPTDLALALDYRIRHILVDEFQDTSHSHFALLQQLTAGWAPGDGRTVFLVGDPMQSIYRFREADVGLFLHVAQHGFAGLAVESLRLSANFRSRPDVVAWVNGVFPQVMPPADDAVAGAVSYTPSTAFVAVDEDDPGERGGPRGVQVHALFKGGSGDDSHGDGDSDSDSDGGTDGYRDAEARRVATIIAAARAEDPGASVALLVRTRAHLEAILPCLRETGIRHRGVDIEPLAEVPAVEDLLALTRALLHPADRVAWLAVLRAPWCGMTLADLHALVVDEPDAAIIDLLDGIEGRGGLSDDGRRRAARLLSVLGPAVGERGRRRLRRWVEGAWVALGGPACVASKELANVDAFLGLLDGLDLAGTPADGDELARRAAQLHAVADVEDADVEIMTMHKAKGLEFDVVIVPGLERGGRADDPHLLAWTRRAGESEDTNFLLAPIPSPAEEAPPIYEYLRDLEADKDLHEQTRLLYVAATRARKALHLLGSVAVDNDGESLRSPAKRSLLKRLWPVVAGAFEEALAARGDTPPQIGGAVARPTVAGLRRLPADWCPPGAPASAVANTDGSEPGDARAPAPVEFDWAGEMARHVGTVIHRALMEISRDGARAWNSARLGHRRNAWQAMLAGLGIPAQAMPAAIARVQEALERVLVDARGRWLLDPGHQAARSELALSGVDAGGLANVVIDRSFVDADGVCWIVDYKSSRHEGGDLQVFLDREQQRYRAQLERYGRLMSAADSRPIRLGLYYPALGGWREWPLPPASGAQ